ncbi:MAG: TetR/AcrR family transcriptional regulator, partial [Actinomycetota bacterium]|nr:TetR/AcrR family transcriptional regulator [Actinomycetota bacterium]
MASQKVKSEVVAAAGRADAARNREQILDAAGKLLAQSPGASLGEIATAAGVSRSTIYRHFGDRAGLIEEVREQPRTAPESTEELLPPGELGREEPVPLDPVQVLDAVAAPLLPEQLVAEAQRIAGVPLGLYVLDIDGSHLLRLAGSEDFPDRLEDPPALGPEIVPEGLPAFYQRLQQR